LISFNPANGNVIEEAFYAFLDYVSDDSWEDPTEITVKALLMTILSLDKVV